MFDLFGLRFTTLAFMCRFFIIWDLIVFPAVAVRHRNGFLVNPRISPTLLYPALNGVTLRPLKNRCFISTVVKSFGEKWPACYIYTNGAFT